ncbi:hypothetical protein K2173_003284 [Erythroxylum novogranatense]|uniref:Phosphoribosylformylglycinamidine synthase n=1 Tax=Erythroxylum novogranatense TaxID=1862640 RepID=A0AAV8SY23_9ROSI|nr:hypothetical protein K2173_003284 [Erythroxylum novogranatense]
MACRTAFRSVFVTESWRPSHPYRAFHSLPSIKFKFSKRKFSCELLRVPDFQFGTQAWLNCSYNNGASPCENDQDQEPPQEAVLKAISEVSKTEGRIGQTTNVVIGGTVTDDSTNEWLTLDQKVNSYPTVRGFTAIGTGGDDFVQSMVVAVESVIQQPIPEGHVRQKVSSRGKYVSVNIGPVQVVSSEQVQAVYNAMRRDDRMKYFL